MSTVHRSMTSWPRVVHRSGGGRGRRRRWGRLGLVVVVSTVLSLVAVAGDLRPGLGAGNRVAPSNADLVVVTVRPPVRPPGPPTDVDVVPGPRSLTVSWRPPADDGGAPVQAYEALSDPRGATCSVAAPATSCTITGLNNGQFFTVTVRAFTTAGPGEPSAPTDPVRPRPN